MTNFDDFLGKALAPMVKLGKRLTSLPKFADPTPLSSRSLLLLKVWYYLPICITPIFLMRWPEWLPAGAKIILLITVAIVIIGYLAIDRYFDSTKLTMGRFRLQCLVTFIPVPLGAIIDGLLFILHRTSFPGLTILAFAHFVILCPSELISNCPTHKELARQK